MSPAADPPADTAFCREGAVEVGSMLWPFTKRTSLGTVRSRSLEFANRSDRVTRARWRARPAGRVAKRNSPEARARRAPGSEIVFSALIGLVPDSADDLVDGWAGAAALVGVDVVGVESLTAFGAITLGVLCESPRALANPTPTMYPAMIATAATAAALASSARAGDSLLLTRGRLPAAASDALAAHEERHRAQQDLDVGPQRPARDVEVVDLDHLGERDLRGAEHLPRARHAGRQVQAPSVQPGDALVLGAHKRARPDEAHLAGQDVEELRDLVERKAPQQSSHGGDAGIVGDLEEPVTRLVALEQLRLHRVGAVDHRAELEDPERLGLAADPRLAEEHGTARAELDRDRRRRDERRHGEQTDRGADDVERPLDHRGGLREAEARDAEQRHAVDVVELHRRADDLEDARHQR